MSKKGVVFLPILIVFLTFFFVTKLSAQTRSQNGNNDSELIKWTEKTAETCGKFSTKKELDACFRRLLKEATANRGAEFATNLLTRLRQKKVIGADFDDHLMAHAVGQALAQHRGLTSTAFLSCSTDYNYGCQHGFFEYALSQTSSHAEAAAKICESLGVDSPPKLYYYCYHGVGHGLMMALSYNLQKSLAVCNQLPKKLATDGCWQGVFMENSNAAIIDETKVVGFSPGNPLSPCNKVAERYRWQCYINHAGYLMKVAKMDLNQAAKICLKAKDTDASACLQSLGLLTTNPLWQKSLLGIDTVSDKKRNVQAAWSLCQKMPEAGLKDCVIGAVDNIHNFDETDISRSSLFCSTVYQDLKNSCFFEIGQSIGSQAKNKNEALSICQQIVDWKNRQSCLQGLENRTKATDEPLFFDDDFLKKQIAAGKPAAVIKKLSELAPKNNLSCHDRAHLVGRFAYELFGEESFKLCDSQCHSGCYHGAAESFFQDKGTDNLQENLAILCQNQTNRFFSHQCLHGVGHGLMAWSNYELYEALSSCDSLDSDENRSSCWTGVFMENIVGGLTVENAGQNFDRDRHYTRYLNNNPHFPCNKVAAKYQGSCYYLQTSRMMQLFNSDFKKIAQECLKAPKVHQYSCFQSMGRDVGGTSKHNVTLAIAKCQHAPAGPPRLECLSGAVQDTFWDKTGENEAAIFCLKLNDGAEINRCWETIVKRAAEVLTSPQYQAFCQRIPRQIKINCPDQKNKTAAQKPPPPRALPTTNQSSSNQTRPQVSTIISMTRDGFSPSKITIKKGSAVVFENKDREIRWPASNIHPTHLIYPDFDPQKPINVGKSWQFVFPKTGLFHYHDHLLPHLSGTIIVIQ